MKRTKKALSLCMVLALILVSTVICSSAETVYDKYDFCYGYDYFLKIGERDGLYREEDLRFATVNGSQFVYVVNDGEATILNVRTNFIGPNKTLFVFPTHLGGYPVTTIGSIKSGKHLCVFDYCQFPYDITPSDTIGEAETDPGLRYVSGIVIPEGYKNIGNSAFVLVWGMTYYLPDSLERLGIMPFELDSIEVRKPWPNMIFGIEPATDTPYVTYGNRDYKINVTGSPSKIQVVRDNGGTTTIDRRKAQVTS
ncbi:MAG: hypothetical protein IJA87_00670, partial [Clostridia bacterium]|nr:hypothetical protein [Clostridia bacterium]